MPRYGDALVERREVRGYATASDLAKKSKEVAERLQDPQLAAFSQQTLSRLEGDKTGELIANARPRIQRMLSYLLGWTAEEFEAHVGVSIPAVPHLPNAPTRPAPPIPPVIPHRETPVSIPPELQQVIDEHSAAYPELRDPTIQRILAAPRNFGGAEAGPQTAQEWLEYFLLTRRYLR